MVEPTTQLVLGGVLGAAAFGSAYVTFNAPRVKRGILWFFVTEAFAVASVLALGGGADEASFVFLGVAVLVSALFAVRLDDLMHATLMVTVTLLGVAGIYLTLGAEFLAAIQVLVYVGAVITLILFTVMLTAPREQEVDLRAIDLPAGIQVERVEAIQSALPAFTGVGPYKDLRETNPRKPTRIPATLEGVYLRDEVVGSPHQPAPRPEGEAKKPKEAKP